MPVTESKFLSREKAREQVLKWQSAGLKVGYTSGTFDLLHSGHVQYLNQAREYCDHLVVGVNSDKSVQSYKGKDRPIVLEQDRSAVLCGLESVSLVFLFDELNNNKNIETLKPDLYIKAGDYQEENLSSAPLVKAYGGEIIIIPFKSGRSSSQIIEKVLQTYAPRIMISEEKVLPEPAPAVFLDRDGTLIEHIEYLHEPERVALLPDGLEPLKKLKEAGYHLIIVTNQPGIGLGYFSKEDFYKVNLALFKKASKAGVLFDKVYFSPFSKAENSTCRKPAAGMVERAVADLNIDLAKSFVIGDTTTDMQLARNIGCPGILVATGSAGEDGVYEATGDVKVTGLKQAVQYILDSTQES